MNRRSFLSCISGAAGMIFVPKLIKLPYRQTVIPVQLFGFKTYSLGFRISQEMLEDDMYGAIQPTMVNMLKYSYDKQAELFLLSSS